MARSKKNKDGENHSERSRPARKVRQLSVKDDEVIKAIKEMKQAEVKMLRDEEQKEVDSVMYKERKVYVPKDNKLRTKIIRLYYNTLVGGHKGQ